MTFVFEASKLHFNESVPCTDREVNSSNEDTKNIIDITHELQCTYHVPSSLLAQLRLYEQRLLLDVLPIVQAAETDNNCVNNENEKEQESLRVALRIVHALDELDEVYSSLQVARAERLASGQRVINAEAAFIAQLHRERRNKKNREAKNDKDTLESSEERIESSSSFSSITSESSHSLINDSDDDNDEDDDQVDIAMCFNVYGDSLGIGSSGMFGKHGYHSSNTQEEFE